MIRARGAPSATIALQRDQRLAREYLARRDPSAADWRAAGEMATYTLRTNPGRTAELIARLDALIRPYIAATRTDADGGRSLVHLGLHAFVLDAER